MARGRRKKKCFFDDDGNEIRICTRCKNAQKLEEFKRSPSWCITCTQEYNKNYQSKKKGSLDHKAKARAKSAVHRSMQQGIDCMDEEALAKEVRRLFYLQHGACFYSGLPINLESTDNQTSISIDRYNSAASKKGTYHAENIVLTCSIINRMKQELSFKEFLYYAKKIVSHYEYLKDEKGIDLCEFN
jgi:CRISPR/Cas system Type II protein with McrA/HNH and RuvC-like nuclease domain